MAQNVNPTFVKTPSATVTYISTGSVGGTASLYTGSANGTKITSVIFTANTTAAFDVRLALVSSTGTIGYLNTVSVASGAGLASASLPVNGLANCPLAIDSDGNPFLFLASSAQSVSMYLTQLSSIWAAGSFISATLTAGDF